MRMTRVDGLVLIGFKSVILVVVFSDPRPRRRPFGGSGPAVPVSSPMESLPYEQRVEIFARLPRGSLISVAQVSTALRDAASDDLLWRDDLWTPNSRCVTLLAVSTWISTRLKFPPQAVYPTLALERNSPFHVRVSLHALKASLGTAETLFGTRHTEKQQPDETNTPLETTPNRNETNRDLVLRAASSQIDEVTRIAERLGELLRDDAARSRRQIKEKGKQTRFSTLAATAAAAVSIRAERGCLRVRFSNAFLVGIGGRIVGPRVSPQMFTGRGNDVGGTPPWSRVLTAGLPNDMHSMSMRVDDQNLIVRLPKPNTRWSLTRARVVGEALRATFAFSRRGAQDASRAYTNHGNESTSQLGWGFATRAVADAASGFPLANAGDVPNETADANAGMAWPALVTDPRDETAVDTSVSSYPQSNAFLTFNQLVTQIERCKRGFVVGGCSCPLLVETVVNETAAALAPASFLERTEGERNKQEGQTTENVSDAKERLGVDSLERPAAVALALLASAQRAHECVLSGPRFSNRLGRSVWALRLARVLRVAPESFGLINSETSDQDTSGGDASSSPNPSHGFVWCSDATDADANLALWLERSHVALVDGMDRWEPREAAEAATELAAAAAPIAHALFNETASSATSGAGAGAGAGALKRSLHVGEDLQQQRRFMLFETRRMLDALLTSVGVLRNAT